MAITNSEDPVDPIDETSDESFPASDPPAWTGTLAAAGSRHATAPHEHPTLRSIRCAEPVEAIVARLERAIASAGSKIFARIDQAEEARNVGLSMRPTVLLLFGSPKGGTPLMTAHPTVAIDLPLKVVVWEDDAGATWLTYNTPALLEERHGLAAPVAGLLASAGELLERALTA